MKLIEPRRIGAVTGKVKSKVNWSFSFFKVHYYDILTGYEPSIFFNMRESVYKILLHTSEGSEHMYCKSVTKVRK